MTLQQPQRYQVTEIFQLRYNLQCDGTTITHTVYHEPKRFQRMAHSVIPEIKKWPEARQTMSGREASTNSSHHSLQMPICSDYMLVWLQRTETVLGAKNTTQFSQRVKCLTKYNLILMRCDLNGGQPSAHRVLLPSLMYFSFFSFSFFFFFSFFCKPNCHSPCLE